MKQQFIRFIAAIRKKVDENLVSFLLYILILACLLAVLIPISFVVVQPGYKGVIYRPLSGGIDESDVLTEGLSFVFPWNSVYKYDARVQLKKLDLEVLTSDQLKSNLSLSLQFTVNATTLPLLHKYIGPDYIETLVIPEVTSIARERFGQLKSDVAFTTDLGSAINDIQIGTDHVIISKLSPMGYNGIRLVHINSVQIESISYPVEMQNAIQDKLVHQQKSQSYVWRLKTEQQEADRKAIEAEGIKRFQSIVNNGLTENYLRYKGIEATEKISGSNNAKIVIIGSGNKGLPLIFGGPDAATK